jgi:hypothetical protein
VVAKTKATSLSLGVSSETLEALSSQVLDLRKIDACKVLKELDKVSGVKAADLDGDGFISGKREMEAIASLAVGTVAFQKKFLTALKPAVVPRCFPEKDVPAKTVLAEKARDSMNRAFSDHELRLAQTGVGTYVGTHSNYIKSSPQERKKTLENTFFPGEAIEEPIPMGCLKWVMTHLKAGFTGAIAKAVLDGDAPKAASLSAHYRTIEATMNKDKASIMWLVEPLRKAGWTVLFFAPDTRHPDEKYEQMKRYQNDVITTALKHRRYMGVPIDGFVLDYRPTHLPNESEQTPKNPTALDALNHVPFFVGLARGGFHSFVGSNGRVNEFHRTYEPGGLSKRAIEETPLSRFDWNSGLILVPPGEWPTK